MDTNTLQQTQAPDTEPAADPAEPSDGRLLTAFVARNDKAAFETLVRRHSELIFGVCHRLLGNVEDAADAFQAVFLVFVRKAASIRRPEAVRAWLYNTAVRTSLKARVIRQRRMSREKEMNAMPEPAMPELAAAAEVASEEELALLDEELRGLPEKYQLPVILCELEGRSRKEAAGILRLAEGTLSSRLATARQKLAARLQRRGVVVPLAGLGLLLAPSAASASMPATLTASTIEAATLYGAGHAATGLVSANAAALTQGVLNGMLLAKLKLAAIAVLMLGVLTAGVQVGLAPEPDKDFYYDFRGSKPVPDALQVFGDNAALKPEEAGLRITAPTDGKQSFGWGVSTRFGLAGDFEVTATYELITVDPPNRGGGAGVALNIAPDFERRKWAKLSRCFRVKEGSVHMAAFWNKDAVQEVRGRGAAFPQGVVVVQEGEHKGRVTIRARGTKGVVPVAPIEVVGPDHEQRLIIGSPAKEHFVPTETRAGQLRLVREGATLRYLANEGPEKEFKEIFREEFGTDDIGLVRFVVNNNASPTAVDAHLVDLRIRTTRKAAVATENAAAQGFTRAVRGIPAPDELSPPPAPSWWRLGAVGALILLLAGVLIVVWITRRRKRNTANPAPSSGAESAAASADTFPCPSCQKRLKRSSAAMGRKVRCPACQATFSPAVLESPSRVK